jgi:SAM-dependent methyltransferase
MRRDEDDMAGDAAAARQDHRFLAELTAAPDTRVLDLGCGDGATLGELAGLVGADGWLLGIDRNPRALATAAPVLRAGASRWLLRADLARRLHIYVYYGAICQEMLKGASRLIEAVLGQELFGLGPADAFLSPRVTLGGMTNGMTGAPPCYFRGRGGSVGTVNAVRKRSRAWIGSPEAQASRATTPA